MNDPAAILIIVWAIGLIPVAFAIPYVLAQLNVPESIFIILAWPAFIACVTMYWILRAAGWCILTMRKAAKALTIRCDEDQ